MTFPLAVEVLMEDRTWQPGVLVRESSTTPGGALITWNGVTGWFFRQQGRGRPNEWRYATAPSAPRESE